MNGIGFNPSMLWQGLIVFAVAAITTYAMVPVSKIIATRVGAIDYPGQRRVNYAPIPRCGGIALYVGFLAGLFAMYLGTRFFGWEYTELYVVRGVDYALLFIGITFMFCVGLVDDITQMKALPKLLGQVVASAIIAYSGVTIGTVVSPLDGTYIMLGGADILLTVVYLVIFVNVTNLIDGLDGLAAGVIAIISCALLYLCISRGSFSLSMACISLVAVCLAFLRFNFYPASIFMGDSGSLLLGSLVGIISIMGVVRTQSVVVMAVPLILAGVPVIDTLSAIVRRKRAHVKVGQADLGHIHHRMLRAGFGQRRTVGVLWICTAVMALFGCLLGSFSGPVRWALFAILAVVVFGVIWYFGLFRPVLRHHYDNKGKSGPRRARRHE